MFVLRIILIQESKRIQIPINLLIYITIKNLNTKQKYVFIIIQLITIIHIFR